MNQWGIQYYVTGLTGPMVPSVHSGWINDLQGETNMSCNVFGSRIQVFLHFLKIFFYGFDIGTQTK